jgi:hypothetical protein
MAIEYLGGGMTDAQLEAYREFKSVGGSWEEFQQLTPDYEDAIANALDNVFGPNGDRLLRILRVAALMALALIASSFALPFLQH